MLRACVRLQYKQAQEMYIIRDSAVSGDTVNISLDNAGEDSTPEHATLVQFYTRIFFYFCKNDKLILDFAIKKDMR